MTPPLRYPPKTAWWLSCFDEATRRQHDVHVREHAAAMSRWLELEPRSRVLDLGCGLGQETMELARRGHRVLGIDADEEALRQARERSRSTDLFCHFLKTDPRTINYSAEFDAVVLRHPCFGGWPRERDDLRMLEGVRKALKPGGRLLLKTVNREWVLRRLDSAPAEAGLRLDLSSGRLHGLSAAGGARSVRLYAFTETLRLLSEAGLASRAVLGRLDGSAYDLESFHMILLASRPVEAAPEPREDEDLPRALKIKGRGR